MASCDMMPGPARSRAEGRKRLVAGICGLTLLEALLVAALLALVTAVTVPTLLTSLDGSRTRGAARYLAGRLYLARIEAVKRSVYVALRVEDAAAGYRYTFYADGNGDGVRSADILDNIDVPIGPGDRLDEKFRGVRFGIVEGIPAIDSPATMLEAGSDPIRFGASSLVSFSPIGSATSGTFYIRGQGKQQMAVRVLGVTGRIRVLRFDFLAGKWMNQ